MDALCLRYTAVQLLEHPWIRQRDTHAPSEHLHATVEQLYRFNTCRKLKGVPLFFIPFTQFLFINIRRMSLLNFNKPTGPCGYRSKLLLT